MKVERQKFEIQPRVIKHLGRDLITSSDVAIVELVKNSIDAKAGEIAIRIYDSVNRVKYSATHLVDIPSDAYYLIPPSLANLPVCLIEDNGKGMNEHQLKDGFLSVGTSIKKNEESETLGEKGIGRLATQRLGCALLVETSSAESPNTVLYTFIDWNSVFSGEASADFIKGMSTTQKSYTRLWIFGIDFSDYLDVADYTQLSFDSDYKCNKELQAALNYLISPFSKGATSPELKLWYDETEIGVNFVANMLELSESTHYFSFDGKALSFGLKLTPSYIERIHLATVKSEAFKRLKKKHSYYKDLLEKNELRINRCLSGSFKEDELLKIVSEYFRKAIPCKNPSLLESYAAMWQNRAKDCVSKIRELVPIDSRIYSYKQNANIGKDIIIDSIIEQKKEEGTWQETDAAVYDLKTLKEFLKNYNGIKLYRGFYRIGFLGNKENDWIKLQQFRTKGQQWYRFDLGNTIGYVALTDPEQGKIQEISSRLDIQENEYSIAFKTLIDIVFNSLFYELNRAANGIIKTILEEEGLLSEPLAKRVKKNERTVKKVVAQNEEMRALLYRVNDELKAEVTQSGDTIVIPKQRYAAVSTILDQITKTSEENVQLSHQTAELLAEANEQLKVIEVESYNNFKLMANGLITETITHELHSVTNSEIDNTIPEHFNQIKLFHRSNHSIPVYNDHIKPIKSAYQTISGKMDRVSDLYTFLETTFIRKGTYDDFIEQNIADVVSDVFTNLQKYADIKNVEMKCNTAELIWYTPKGVLLHVFYNLFANSLYWIDNRRERAKTDSKYIVDGHDYILVEPCGDNEIIVSDSGPGISTSMEDILFEPLQSGKPNNEGRGMGLYIVRQLMQSFGGDIHLLNERNQLGNRYKFVLTLKEE